MENQNRVAKIVLLVVAFVLVLCVGVAVGGAAVYGVTRLGDRIHIPWLAGKRPEVSLGDVIEEPAVQVLTAGARIVEVVADSPAEGAGLQQGDIIVAVDGQQVGVEDDLAGLIAAYEPGDRVTLTLRRADENDKEIRVQLGENPDEEGAPYLGVRYSTVGAFESPGLRVMPFRGPQGSVPEDLPFPLPRGGQGGGVVIVAVAEDSPAAAAGLEPGDVLAALDDQALVRPRELTAAIAEREPGDTVTLTVYPAGDEGERQVEVKLAEHPDREGDAYLGVTIGGMYRFYRFPGSEGEGLPEGLDLGSGPFRFGLRFDELPLDKLPSDWQDLLRQFQFDLAPADLGDSI